MLKMGFDLRRGRSYRNERFEFEIARNLHHNGRIKSTGRRRRTAREDGETSFGWSGGEHKP